MILRIHDRQNHVMGTTELTGKHWIIGHNGFVNAEDFIVVIAISGEPCRYTMVDYLGAVRSDGSLKSGRPWLSAGDRLLIAKEDFVISLELGRPFVGPETGG